jgi:hypothetical protein
MSPSTKVDFDMARIRRERIRWLILLTLYNARPIGAFEMLVLSVIQAEYSDSTQNGLRRELDYLANRVLIKTKNSSDDRWFAEITCYGVDVVECTIGVDPGISRPEKFFDGVVPDILQKRQSGSLEASIENSV